MREDEEATAALGKDVFKYKLQAFSAGAALAGLAGLFLAWQVSTFTPDDFRPTLTFYAFVIVILGGKTNVWAVPIGAIVFAVIFAGTRFLDFWPLSLFSSGDRAFLRLIFPDLRELAPYDLLVEASELFDPGPVGVREKELLELLKS